MYFERLRKIREEKGYTQTEVANILGITKGSYSMNEEGHDTITLINLIKYCDFFNYSVDYVMGLSDVPRYQETNKGFNKDILKTRLKKFRKNNNLTQEKVSLKLGINHSVWCRYEKGITTINTTLLYIFCKEFHINADYLLGKIDVPKYIN